MRNRCNARTLPPPIPGYLPPNHTRFWLASKQERVLVLALVDLFAAFANL